MSTEKVESDDSCKDHNDLEKKFLTVLTRKNKENDDGDDETNDDLQQTFSSAIRNNEDARNHMFVAMMDVLQLAGENIASNDEEQAEVDNVLAIFAGAKRRTQEALAEKNFDSWMELWPTEDYPKGPPKTELVGLAKRLCNSATDHGHSEDNAQKESTGTDADDHGTIREEDIVSWEGISVDWLMDVFWKTPEMQAFADYGCRMWFLRNFGIPEILSHRGITKGCLIERVETFDTSISRNDVVGIASVFISYTGSTKMAQFVELMKGIRGKRVWTDTLCVNQFAWNSKRNNKDMIAFKDRFMYKLADQIKEIKCTVLMLNEWDDVMSVLGKIWVLWEVFSTLDNVDSTFDVLLDENQRRSFINHGLGSKRGYESIQASLAQVDAEKAKSFDPNDRTLILDLMKKSAGVFNVNKEVVNRMQRWLLESGRVQYDRYEIGEDDDNSKMLEKKKLGNNLAALCGELDRLEEAERLRIEQLEICEGLTSDDKDVEILDAKSALGSVLLRRGKLEEAEKLLNAALDGLKPIVGLAHETAVLTQNNLAVLYNSTGKPDKAKELLEEVVRNLGKETGETSEDTLAAKLNLAYALKEIGDFDEAERLYCHVVDVRTKRFGTGLHPRILVVRNNVALIKSMRGAIDEAEQILREVLQGCREQLGENHQQTLLTMSNLAGLLSKRGRATNDDDLLQEAQSLFEDILSGYRTILGESHPFAITAQYNTGGILAARGQGSAAQPYFREALQWSRALYGNKSDLTLEFIFQMASFLRVQGGDKNEVQTVLREARDCFREAKGADHPNTRQLQAALDELEMNEQMK